MKWFLTWGSSVITKGHEPLGKSRTFSNLTDYSQREQCQVIFDNNVANSYSIKQLITYSQFPSKSGRAFYSQLQEEGPGGKDKVRDDLGSKKVKNRCHDGIASLRFPCVMKGSMRKSSRRQWPRSRFLARDARDCIQGDHRMQSRVRW